MANDYCTAAEIKAQMPDTSWSTTYDTILATLATRASRAIDRHLKREAGAFYVSSDTTRYFDGSGGQYLWVNELAAAPTSVAVAEAGDTSDYTSWASTDYILWPYNAALAGRPYQRLDVDQLNGTKSIWYRFPKSVKIVGKFGYATTIPDTIKQATVVQAIRYFKRGQQAYQDVGAIADLGQLRYVKGVDPEVAEMLELYRPVTI